MLISNKNINFVGLNNRQMFFSDTDILTAFGQNTEEGGRRLFQRYYKPLVLFCGSFLNDDHFPEDIVQEIFYQFIKNKTYLQLTPVTLSGYLFKSVKNACLNKIRDQKKFTTAEKLKFEAIEEEAQTISPELIRSVVEAIHALPEKTRLVVEAIVIRDKKYKEAAEELGCSVNTVKTLLANGLKQLRRQFSDTLLLLVLFGDVNNY